MARKLLLLLLLAAAGAAAFWATLPEVSSLRRATPKTTAFMRLRQRDLARWGQSTRLDRVVVPLSAISPWMRRAAIVTEDARFYEHGGIDWEATREAAVEDWEKRRLRVGGSTITQQLARNLYLSPARTPWRKLREWAIAWELERELSKRRILELYLNSVELGTRIYGVEAASRAYFGHGAATLSPEESAMLAAMFASPRLYNPRRPTRAFRRRTARILRRLLRADHAPPIPAPPRAAVSPPGPSGVPAPVTPSGAAAGPGAPTGPSGAAS